MRFLFFPAQYLPTVGGVERYTYNLCKTLTGMGHECTVVTSALPSLETDEIAEQIRTVRLPSALMMKGRFPVVKKNKEFIRLIDSVFEKPYDLAVINTRFYHLSLIAAKLCFKQGLPAVIIEHGTKHLSLGNPLLDIFGNLYEHVAIKYAAKYCSCFFGVSAACRVWLRHFGIKAKGVLFNAVDVDAVAKTASGSGYDARERFSLSETAPLIVFSSRFIKEKGILELLAAFKNFREANPEAVLVMSGDGPLFAQIENRLPEGVHLTGRLSYSDNLALIGQCDVFLLPTYYPEGFPTVVLEAAALGLCVITTPVGGCAELIESGKSGILIEEATPANIENALSAVFSDNEFRKQAGELLREKTKREFSWSRTAASLLEIAAQNDGV